jgi:hypothetical protein
MGHFGERAVVFGNFKAGFNFNMYDKAIAKLVLAQKEPRDVVVLSLKCQAKS